jgi:chromosome segregation ATPase
MMPLTKYWASTGIRTIQSNQHEEQAVYLAADVEAREKIMVEALTRLSTLITWRRECGRLEHEISQLKEEVVDQGEQDTKEIERLRQQLTHMNDGFDMVRQANKELHQQHEADQARIKELECSAELDRAAYAIHGTLRQQVADLTTWLEIARDANAAWNLYAETLTAQLAQVTQERDENKLKCEQLKDDLNEVARRDIRLT